MNEGNEKGTPFGPQSFIIKLWVEEEVETSERTAWQGSITHIPSGERRSFRRLDEIAGLIQLYLPDTGKTRGRLRGYWECLKHCYKR